MTRRYTRTVVFLFALISFCLQHTSSFATHNRAGNISIEQIDDLTVRAVIFTWTKTSSTGADRDSLEVFWGDGQSSFALRTQEEVLDNDIKFNKYEAIHTYPGRGTYKIAFRDPNRDANILNVNAPNSVNVQFYLETTYTFLNTQFQGPNNTPQLLRAPIDFGCIGVPFKYSPNAFDLESDSLAFELIVPLEDENQIVPLYQFPSQIIPGPLNNHFLNPNTGEFVWTSPQKAGEYNIAILVKEYRQGTLISETVRDIQIHIEECDNYPPVVETVSELCVIAGDTIQFDVIASDVDTGQFVRLDATGAPFISPFGNATFDVAMGFQPSPLSAVFTWETTCEHISDQYYTVVFRAVDNFYDTTGLADLKTVRIKVVGPPPEDLTAESNREEITLSWFKPYDCEDVADDYFRGFSVWRREGGNTFPIDTCRPGLGGRGYTKIEFNTVEMDNGRYVYIDSDLERGRSYCYRVLAEFARISSAGFPFNIVESLPSEEVCIQLSRDIPIITHADVEVTDASAGEVTVQWSKPFAEDLDTIFFTGPYIYEVWRGDGIQPAVLQPIPGAKLTSQWFAHANDTSYLDMGINTSQQANTYQILFMANDERDTVGFTRTASTVFLGISPTDKANVLSWTESVPWENTRYNIYLQNMPGVFDSIGMSMDRSYRHTGLENETEYCYYVESVGSYGIKQIVNPIRNKSQQTCGTPIDNVPPCAPALSVSNICDQANPDTPSNLFENNLYWTNPNNACDETDDVEEYRIYFTPIEGGSLTLIETITFAGDTTYIHQPDFGIAGCYAVSAVDEKGNESALSNIVCVDNCPAFELPNAFTPNGDGANELFVPVNNRFISQVEFKVFNRWGQLVFETTNPVLGWSGKNLAGKDLPDGVYYYVCRVFEQRVAGIAEQEDLLQGYIELLR